MRTPEVELVHDHLYWPGSRRVLLHVGQTSAEKSVINVYRKNSNRTLEPTDRWCVINFVSQKRNESNDKNQLYHILPTFVIELKIWLVSYRLTYLDTVIFQFLIHYLPILKPARPYESCKNIRGPAPLICRSALWELVHNWYKTLRPDHIGTKLVQNSLDWSYWKS